MKKMKIFILVLAVLLAGQLFMACGSSDNTYYETPQDWKNGNSYSGTYTAQTAFVWYMQTSLVTIVTDKLNKNKGESTLISEEHGAVKETKEKSNSNSFNNLPMINDYGQLLGIMDNPDPDHPLNIRIYQEGFDFPIIDETLDENRPGKYFRAKSYLLPGKYKKVLTPLSDLASPVTIEFEVTAFEVGYLGERYYWKAIGGTGNWTQCK